MRAVVRPFERGQAIPLAALLLLVALGVMWFVVQIGEHALTLAEAQTAADAAALAGAISSPNVASDVAMRNGADVVRVEVTASGATARVQIGDVERLAAAQRPRERDNGLAPGMLAAIGTTEAAIGRSVPIVSGYRSRAGQQWLWDHRFDNEYPVASPGTSLHELGLAIDVPEWFVPLLARFGPSSGLCQPLPGIDPVHFELCRKKPSR